MKTLLAVLSLLVMVAPVIPGLTDHEAPGILPTTFVRSQRSQANAAISSTQRSTCT